jgi:hypothetical protein
MACCEGNIVDYCQGAVCLPENAACFQNGDCCSQNCAGWDGGAAGICEPAGFLNCFPGNTSCSQGSDCCSGVCNPPPTDDAGLAQDAGSTCTYVQQVCQFSGGACYTDSDCCSAVCVISDGGFSCQ